MIDIALVKQQARIDGDAEDALIQSYIDAAIAHVEMHCDRVIVEVPATDGEMALTADVHQAVIMLVAHWYANRETASDQVSAEVPHGFDQILWYRKRF